MNVLQDITGTASSAAAPPHPPTALPSAALPLPSAALPLPSAALPLPSAALPLPSAALALPSAALAQSAARWAGQQAQGIDSLRSSDEFPANKENSHRQWHRSQGTVALVKGAVGTAAANMVSEQVLAQEAVYALQVTSVVHVCSVLAKLAVTIASQHSRFKTFKQAVRCFTL